MTATLDRLLEVLPPPYTLEPGSVLLQVLDAVALQSEVVQEDLDRLRRAHWLDFAYRLGDLEKLGALVDVARLGWEGPELFRLRLRALVRARFNGAVGVGDIKTFVYSYLREAERALGSVFVPGLPSVGTGEEDAAFTADPQRPSFRPLRLVENPPLRRRSPTLVARNGDVPYLFRWEERNGGLTEVPVAVTITGRSGGRTAVPLVVNLTTGQLIGYRGVLATGQRLRAQAAGEAGTAAVGTIDGRQDVTSRLFSVQAFAPGQHLGPAGLDDVPRVPTMARGVNAWAYLSVGLYDVKGLDAFFLSMAGADLREGVFNTTAFDASLFPSGTVARLGLEWVETQPASFEVRVPRGIVVEPSHRVAHRELAAAITAGVGQLRALGVRARARFEPFREVQDQRDAVQLPWVKLDRELGPLGGERVSLGARYGESGLDQSRFG